MRVVLGFLIAPGLGAFFALAVLGSRGHLAAMAAYMYADALLVAVPAYAFFRMKGWLAWWQCVVLGVIAGLPLLALILHGLGFTPALALQHLFAWNIPLVGIIVGAFTGLVFWFLAHFKV